MTVQGVEVSSDSLLPLLLSFLQFLLREFSELQEFIYLVYSHHSQIFMTKKVGKLTVRRGLCQTEREGKEA